MPNTELGPWHITQAASHMRELATMDHAADGADMLRRQFGTQASSLLVGHTITVVDLQVQDTPYPYRPIYAYAVFNEGMVVLGNERERLDAALGSYEASGRRWIPRQAWFTSKKQHTGQVVGIDAENASLVMAGAHIKLWIV